MYHLVIKIFLVGIIILFIPQIVQAGFLDDLAYCTGSGNCNFEDITIAFSSFIKLLLGGFGAVALVYFVWGGTRWLISGGNMEKVAEGRTIMINTVFAMILAFGSYLVVNFFINDVLSVRPSFKVAEGQFTSCVGEARGQTCGDNKQCVGSIVSPHPRANLSGKCLDVCQIETIDDPVLGECVNILPADWQEKTGISLCSDNKKCGLPPAP